MFTVRTLFVMLALTTLSSAQVQISIGVRETEIGGDTFVGIGGAGSASGGIEWINLDTQTLVLDGTWQLFTFNLTTDPIAAFAGSTANSLLEGTFGTFEHIRILNSGGQDGPLSFWVDDVTNTVTPSGGSPTSTTFADFEGYLQGDEVMFQEPSFSGSTTGNVVAGGTAGVDNWVASRTASDRFDLQFVDATPTRWVRMTTYAARNLGNPQVRFDDQSVITFWMRGGTGQGNLGLQGPGTVIAEMVGSGLKAGQSSTYYVTGAPTSTPGAIFLSLAGQPDFPIVGGTLASGLGLLVVVPVAADPAGQLSVPVAGSFGIVDLAVQTVVLDTTLPQLFAFSNAVQARFGQ